MFFCFFDIILKIVVLMGIGGAYFIKLSAVQPLWNSLRKCSKNDPQNMYLINGGQHRELVIKGNALGEPQYEEGKTTLNQEQRVIVKKLSKLLNYGQDDYLDNLVQSYSPKGFIDF